jgi:hypothetical protein
MATAASADCRHLGRCGQSASTKNQGHWTDR